MIPGDVIQNIQTSFDAGFYEIVLTGIHIGHYGKDLAQDIDLTRLLEKIVQKTKGGRIRLSSIEPEELSDDILKLIADSGGRICPHLHIPLQSGTDTILSKMGRRYTTSDYQTLIMKIRKMMPDTTIGADVITGFPSESESDFAKTRHFIEELPISYLHVFTYSDRKGTPSFQMKDKVDEGTKRERTNILRALSREKRISHLKGFIGSQVTVVFDKNRVDGYNKGVSEHYITVNAKRRTAGAGGQKVKLLSIDDEKMLGEAI